MQHIPGQLHIGLVLIKNISYRVRLVQEAAYFQVVKQALGGRPNELNCGCIQPDRLKASHWQRL